MKSLALALALFASPAFADSDLPPAQFDIGGETVAETVELLKEMFGTDTPVLYAVVEEDVKFMCDFISLERYGTLYPAGGGPNETLVGCLIRNAPDNSNPAIVYSSLKVLRHEIGHHLGWPGEHPR